MTYAQNLWLYCVLLFGIIAVPGMDMFFIMANGLSGGRKRAAAALAGVLSGGLFHTLFGAFALSAIVATAPQLLLLILFASALYMGWIGWTLVRSTITVAAIGSTSVRGNAMAFRQGLVTCILNPKAYLFTTAVYPQFIRPEYGPVWSQAVVMGVLTATCQFLIYGSLGLAAAAGNSLLVRHQRATIWIGRGAGILFLLLAAMTFWRILHA